LLLDVVAPGREEPYVGPRFDGMPYTGSLLKQQKGKVALDAVGRCCEPYWAGADDDDRELGEVFGRLGFVGGRPSTAV